MNFPVHPLEEAARRAIAKNRIGKASVMAYWAWVYEITSEELAGANEAKWLRFRDGVRQKAKKDYGVPSKQTRALIISKLRELENRKERAA